MTRAERRDLLVDFAGFAGVARGRPDSERERLVDRFIAERQGGALGYSDDELKGTARDEPDAELGGSV